MSRRDLSLANKIAILDQIKGQPPNTSHRILSEITGVPKSTVARLIHQQDKLREEYTLCEGQQRRARKRKREGKFPDIEEALNQWYSITTELGMCVCASMLKTKSEELAKKFGHEDFKAKDGWLSRWKLRHGIKPRTGLGEKSRRSHANLFETEKLLELIDKFGADCVYSASEIVFLCRAMPDGSLCYKHQPLSGPKKAMDQLTVLCCSNMLGTDKRKLLVVGRTANPPCLKGLRMDSLPVVYVANKKGLMTSEIFTKWLLSWDMELRQQIRTIVLVLRDCEVHPRLDYLENIHLEFVSTQQATSLVLPMDMGITSDLKMTYRDRLVNYLSGAIEDNLIVEVSARVSLLQAMQFLADSWREISSNTIKNCFNLSGFRYSDIEVPDGTIRLCKHDTFWQLHHVNNYEKFVCNDNNIQFYEDNDCKDVVAEQIRHQMISVDEENGEVYSCKHEQLTIQDAQRFIDGLRLYFMQKGNEGSPQSELEVCADFVHFQSVKRIRSLCHNETESSE